MDGPHPEGRKNRRVLRSPMEYPNRVSADNMSEIMHKTRIVSRVHTINAVLHRMISDDLFREICLQSWTAMGYQHVERPY
jgi:hypothetical protein